MVDFSNIKKIEIPEGEVKSISRNGTILWQVKGGLPSEYQQVEYIQSTGSQYLDTGVSPTINTKIEIKFKQPVFGSRAYRGGIYGGEESWGTNAFHLYWTSDVFDVGFSSNVENFSNFYENTVYEAKISNGLVNINGTDYTGPSGSISTNNSVYLFALHRASVITESACNKIIYYCKFYNNGVLVKDFVPCYRKSDGVIGMYDLVNDEFKTNKGTGTFGKGQDV